MANTPCFQELFVSNGNQVLASGQAIVMIKKVLEYDINNSGRPFIPYVGMILNANGVYVPDTIANNQANIASFIAIAKDCRQASIDSAQGVIGGQYGITSPYYSSYLDKLTGNDLIMYQRYLQLYGIVFDFWTSANPAWTAEQYYNALTGLVNKLIAEADKRLYIPPALYKFGALSATYIALNTWVTAVPAFAGMLGVEYYQ